MKENNQDKINELLIAKIHAELSQEEEVVLENLLADTVVKKQFKDFKKLNHDIESSIGFNKFSADTSWDKIKAEVVNARIKTIQLFARYAAIIIVSGLIGFVINNIDKGEAYYTTVNVPIGQMSEIELQDGTLVWLNSGTTLKYSNQFGRDVRAVELHGEAFFDVTKTGTPFLVKFKDKEVEVLGTKFNVRAYNNMDISRVTLVEGLVNINDHQGQYITNLHPQQQLVFNHINEEFSVNAIDDGSDMYWMQGKSVFREEKLSKIAERIETWYDVDVIFADPELENLYFSGTIVKDKPLAHVLIAIELLLPVEFEHKHNINGKEEIIINKR